MHYLKVCEYSTELNLKMNAILNINDVEINGTVNSIY